MPSGMRRARALDAVKSTRLGRCGRTDGAACEFAIALCECQKIARESCVLIKLILAAVAPPQKPHWTLVAFDMSQLRLMWFARLHRRTEKYALLGGPMLLTRREAIAGCWRRAGLLKVAPARGRDGLSQPNHQDDRALSGRRHHRFSRPPGRRSAQDRSWRDRHRREQAGSRDHARRGAGGKGRARRLHAVDGDLDHARHQQDALQEAALRSGEGFYADRAGGRRAVRADHQPTDSGEDAVRIHRLRQIEAGTGLSVRPAMAVRSISAPRC